MKISVPYTVDVPDGEENEVAMQNYTGLCMLCTLCTCMLVRRRWYSINYHYLNVLLAVACTSKAKYLQ